MVRTIEQIIASAPQNARDFLAQMAGRGQLAFSFEQVYSKIRLAPDTITADGSNNTTYTFNAGHVVNAFMYGYGGSMVSAGFDGTLTPYQQATYADTSLQKGTGRETNNGGAMLIEGVAFEVEPTSDPFMLQRLIPETFVTMGFGDNLTQYRLGKIPFMPGAGAIEGAGTTQGQMGGLGDTNAILPGFPRNGMALDKNYRELEDKILWKPSPDPEANLGMVITVPRTVSYIAPGRAAAAGSTAAVVPPLTLGAYHTYVEFTVRLFGPTFRNRTTNT